MEETRLSSQRASKDDNHDPQNAGGLGSTTTDTAEDESTAGVSNQDSWRIEGDYLVRVHRAPRTTLFSPVEVPDDPPPIDVKNIEVLRTTKPLFAGMQWPEMNVLEDAWSGNPSDARSLQSPSDGSTLTWTGETCSVTQQLLGRLNLEKSCVPPIAAVSREYHWKTCHRQLLQFLQR